jgi:hypothetical protein
MIYKARAQKNKGQGNVENGEAERNQGIAVFDIGKNLPLPIIRNRRNSIITFCVPV